MNSNSPMLIEANAARVIKAITNTPIKISNEAEVIDMCKAVEDMIKDSKNEGMEIGMEKGMKKGMEIGRLNTIASFVKDGIISVKDAAARLGMTEDSFKKVMQESSI